MSDRFPTSANLLAGIHDGDESAIRELFLLYAPLLRDQARRLGIDGDERDDMVTTLLDDVVLHLMEHRLAPRDLARYLVAAFRNRARRGHRDALRRDTNTGAGSSEIGAARQRIVAECISEYTLAVSTISESTTPSRAVILGLARCVATELSADEMRMMIGIGRHIPLREIADQLQITYGAARVRVHRLRERFRRIASEYVATLKADERNEITRFFRRAEFELMPSASNNSSTQPVLREQSQ
ncbi:MAG TPA: sigma-70 family RNA polymerase sigma factor [Gemmatimonadaceae bacterium]|nr:sigma-70 family RNA polymerase sigma factor [Gemmatimonadaceae bacterium]